MATKSKVKLSEPAQQQQVLAPNAMQEMLLSFPLDHHICAGQAKGTGKSFGVLFLVLRDSQILKINYKCLITRGTYQSLIELQSVLYKYLTTFIPGTTWTGADNTFRLGGKDCPFGSVELAFTAASPMEQVRSLTRLQGRSFSCIIHDEAGAQSSFDFYDQLMGCLRAAPGVPTRCIWLANPGGPAHWVIRQRFAIPAGLPTHLQPRRFWSEEYQRHTVFLTADASCNPHLALDELQKQVTIMAGGDPALLAALLQGDWSSDLSGGAFLGACWSPARCRYEIKPGDIDLRNHHPRPFVCGDFGIAAPSVFFLVVPNPPGIDAPKGTLLLADELYIAASTPGGTRDWGKGNHLSSAQQAEVLVRWLKRWGVGPDDLPLLCDDAIFSANGAPAGSTAGDFLAAGVRFRPAEKMKTPMNVGLAMLRNRLTASRKDFTSPWLLWSTACAGWEATAPGVPRHPRDYEVIADGCTDHALDAARYAVAWYNAKWKVGNTNIGVW